jgi:putative oxidoreductase
MPAPNRYVELLGRILLSAMFFSSGIGKIVTYADTQGYMQAMGVPPALLPLVILLELVAPVAVVVGWQTRWFAALLAGFCIVSALLFHADFADQAQMINFMKNVTIAGGFALLVATGAGPISLDARRRP